MKIAILGLWHSGEVYSACLADLGYKIIGIDENTKIVNNLNHGTAPLAEPKLESIIKKNIKKGRLKYSTDFSSLSACDVVWITVDTPLEKEDQGDLSEIFNYTNKALPYLKKGVLIIISSQLPVGTSAKIIKFVSASRKNFKFDYAYQPENLRLGEAINNFMKPSRIIIGMNNLKRRKEITNIFRKLKTKILVMNVTSAEMVKHATNAFLATSLCFIYDIADICERVGADITDVTQGLRADERIGEGAYLDASAGFSGGHLERELNYLRKVAGSRKIKLPVIASVVRKNNGRRKIVFKKISPLLGTFKNKRVTFLGITYKSGTPTLTSSLPIVLAKEMLFKGSKINLCDPWINKDEITKEIAAGKYSYFEDPYKSAWSSHVIICITPWEDLKKLDFRKIASLMASPKIFFDARNYFSNMKDIIEDAGIKYIGVGR